MHSSEDIVKDRAIDEREGGNYIALLYSFPAEDGSNCVVNHVVPKGGWNEVPSFNNDGELRKGGVYSVENFVPGC